MEEKLQRRLSLFAVQTKKQIQILIGKIPISLNFSTSSLTLLAFFKSKEMEESLVVGKQKQPTVDEGCIYKGITIQPSKGNKSQKVIFEKPTIEMTKTHLMSNLEREPHKRVINEKYLKKYFPTMCEMLDITQRIRLILRLIKA